jgi:hypothetical protein
MAAPVLTYLLSTVHRRKRLDDVEILLDQGRARQPEIRLDLEQLLKGWLSAQARAGPN